MREAILPWEIDTSEELAHPTLDFHQLPQGVGFGRAYCPRIAHLRQELGDYIEVVLNLDCQQRSADKILEDVHNAVKEFEHEKRFDFSRRRRKVQKVCVR